MVLWASPVRSAASQACLWPLLLKLITGPTIFNVFHPLYSEFHLQRVQRYNRVREVCLHYLIYQLAYLVVVTEVLRASQEIHCKAGSMNAPRTLETCMTCPWGQTILVTVVSKCIAFWQKGRQLTSFAVSHRVVHLWLRSGACVFDRFGFFAAGGKGTGFKCKLVWTACCMWPWFL